MSRALVILRGKEDRERVARWAEKAPPGTRVEFKQTKRSLDQNAKMWATLTDIASQKEHFGRKYTPDIWKLIMLNAFGQENKFVPSLDGSTIVPIGQSSSDLSKQEMSEFLEFILSWCSEHSITLHDNQEHAA